jgi:hypothetical protein
MLWRVSRYRVTHNRKRNTRICRWRHAAAQSGITMTKKSGRRTDARRLITLAPTQVQQQVSNSNTTLLPTTSIVATQLRRPRTTPMFAHRRNGRSR